MAQKFANSARAELASAISASDTTLAIVSGGSLFPVANTGAAAISPASDWFKLVLQDDVGIEIVFVRTHTGGSSSFSNVMRGQEGTTARGFDAASIVGLRPTAGDSDGVLKLGEVASADSKDAPADADSLPLVDSAAPSSIKRLTWGGLKSATKTFFDTLYLPEAPDDGKQYARKSKGWIEVAAAGTITPFSQTLLAAEDADTWRTLLGVAPDPLVYSMAYLTDPTLTSGALQSWLGVSANRANYQTLLATPARCDELSDTLSFKGVLLGSTLASGDWSASPSAMDALVATDTRMEYLIASQAYLDWMLASPARWSVLMGNPAKSQVQTPVMTSATSPYGQVTQSSQGNTTSQAGFQAFGTNGSNLWAAVSSTSTHWVQWVWAGGTPQSIQEITINPGNRAAFAFANVRFTADGVTWQGSVSVANNTGLQTIQVAIPGKFIGIRFEGQRGGGLNDTLTCDAFRVKGFA